jgi:gas vesicle protein
MVSLNEHITIFRKLHIPYKKQLVQMMIHIMKDHYSLARDCFVDTSNNETITIEEFLNQIMTPQEKWKEKWEQEYRESVKEATP